MTTTPEPPPELLLKLARILEDDAMGLTAQECDLLDYVDDLEAKIRGLTRQRDEAQVQAADNAREGELQGERLRGRIAELQATIARVEALADDWDSVLEPCGVDVRRALAVTAPPPDEHGATTQPHAFLDDSHGICGFEDANENDCGGRRDDPTHVTAPPETLGEKLLRDIFTDPGQRGLKKVAEGFHEFGKAAAWPPATPVEEPADYSPLCAECEAADREQPMCNDCHATFQREHAARTARARRLGSAGPVKEDRP